MTDLIKKIEGFPIFKSPSLPITITDRENEREIKINMIEDEGTFHVSEELYEELKKEGLDDL